MAPADEGPSTTPGRQVGAITGNAAAVLASTAAGVAIAFATSLVIARVLGPQGRGVVAVLQTDAVVLASILGLGVPWAVYHYASYSREPQPLLMGVSIVHALLLAAVALFLAWLLGPTLARAQDVPDGRELFLIAAVLAPATFLEYAFVDTLRSKRHLALANRILVASRALGFVAALLLVAALDLGVRGALVALIVAPACAALAAMPRLLRRGIALTRSAARQVLGYGLRVQAASVSRLLSRRFDVLVLSLFVSSAEVGHYAVAQSLAELPLLVPQAFGVILAPLITGGEADRAVTHRVIRLNGSAALLVALVVAVTAPWLVVAAFGESFAPSVVPLLIIAPGAWMFACGEFCSHVLAARGMPGTASWLSAFQATVTVGLDIVLVPAYGIEGAAVASTIAYTAYGFASLVVVGRHDGVKVRHLLVATADELRHHGRQLRLVLVRR